MKKIIVAVLFGILMASSANAEVSAIKVCDEKTLTASTTTDCDYVDLGDAKFFSYQFRCNSASTTLTIHLDWVAGAANSAATDFAVPVLATGTAMSQLRTTYTTESTTTFTALQSIQPPISKYGTLRFTNNASTADVICTAILVLGN